MKPEIPVPHLNTQIAEGDQVEWRRDGRPITYRAEVLRNKRYGARPILLRLLSKAGRPVALTKVWVGITNIAAVFHAKQPRAHG